ncbi:hypothetical protein [Blastococcus sp. SYSU D00820]
MRTRLVLGGLVWVAVTVAAALTLDPVWAVFVGIVAASLWGVVALAGDWDQHSSFEQRELDRARRRAEKWERNKDARERDRARWEAHQARKAQREGSR